jgi:tol-pal system protein YbgF
VKKLFVASILLALAIVEPSFAKKNADEFAEPASELQSIVETQGQNLATVSNQVNEVVSRFQTVNGDVSRVSKKISDHERVINDLVNRLQVAEDKITVLTGQLQELRSEGLMKPQASARFREFQAYSKGLEYVNSKQYDKAVSEFQKFIQENTKSIYTTYAQYWIGESYFLQSDYPMAIKQYQVLLQKDSRSAKAATALYRQGLSFYNLQSLDDAKVFFEKVIRTYPQSIEAIQANGQIKRITNIQELKKQQELEMKMVQ